MWCPDEEAKRLGIRVLPSTIMTERGLWIPTMNTILLRADLTTTERRCVLAHELAHAHYGDAISWHPNEPRADRWAAGRLIDPAALAASARTTDNAAEWCEHLQVTPELLKAWLSQPKNRQLLEALIGDRDG